MINLNSLNQWRDTRPETLAWLKKSGVTERYWHKHGIFFVPIDSHPLKNVKVLASNGAGWDHVSVSFPDRCPTWDEMDYVKRMFFHATDTVMQLHVPYVDHISHHPFCLHLWRPHGRAIPRPPNALVGAP